MLQTSNPPFSSTPAATPEAASPADKKGKEESLKTKKERRAGRRRLCSSLVEIAWLNEQSGQISTVGVIEDVSHGGLCVNLDSPLPVGALVSLRTKGFCGQARVRYCNSSGCGGQVAGLEFAGGCSWEPEKWSPGHLLCAEPGAQSR